MTSINGSKLEQHGSTGKLKTGGIECLGTRLAPPLHDHEVHDISYQLHYQHIPSCSAHASQIVNIVHVESASLGTGSISSCSSIDAKQTFCVLRCVHSQVQPCRGGEQHTSHTLVSVGCTLNCQSPDIIAITSDIVKLFATVLQKR